MPARDRLQLARDAYGAYESGDRGVVEELLTEDFTFYSPADVGIDRARYFERCWPNAELIESFEFKRLVEDRRKPVSQHRGPHVCRRQDQ
jgi:ketosteroid isomerase-like protein